MDLLRALGVFVRVVETGSFSAVARETGINHTSVTRLIGQLEDHFGARLFNRSTRHLSLTDDGQELLGQAHQLLDSAQELEAALGRQRESPTGRVRLGLPASAATWFLPRLAQLFARYPGLSVDLVIGDRFDDLVEQRLDLALQRARPENGSVVVRAIARIGLVVVATPAYLQQHGTPIHPGDLAQHNCIVYEAGPDSDRWSFTGPAGQVDVRVHGTLHANTAAIVHQAALCDYGVAILLATQVLHDIRAGRLCRLLPAYACEQHQSFVLYPSRRHLPPRTRVVIDFLVAVGREAGIQDVDRTADGEEVSYQPAEPLTDGP